MSENLETKIKVPTQQVDITKPNAEYMTVSSLLI